MSTVTARIFQLDPARAAAPPETDLVRAMFEGLTEIDPATMTERPAAAERWTSTPDHRNWTFYLRGDARWSNGKPVTAYDFVRSWKRLAALGDKAAHTDLLTNIMGFPRGNSVITTEIGPAEPANPAETPGSTPAGNAAAPTPTPAKPAAAETAPAIKAPLTLGVVAAGPGTLNVSLVVPDKDFPKLVAHPIFRPVFDGAALDEQGLDPNTVTNGAFRVASVGDDGIVLERSPTYWNKAAVSLERVRFVPAADAESALKSYRSGELDAVSNVDFAPLALKLLAPYEDFRRTTHSALNFYEINYQRKPFDDRRVREALAISIERERLTEGELEGSTRPALQFMPYSKTAGSLIQDKARARLLLRDAGFPDGEGFPVIRLVINRNDTQQRIARSVAKMWKQNLNLDTEIIVKESSEIEAARSSGDFDLIRRGVVLPTPDEAVSFLTIFAEGVPVVNVSARDQSIHRESGADVPPASDTQPPLVENAAKEMILDEEDALYQVRAIPLYFPS